jgi:FkbM family methyltransferase
LFEDNFALKNFSLNEKLASKIVPHNFGLWNEDAEIEIYTYNEDFRTAINSVSDFSGAKTFKGSNGHQKLSKAPVKKSSSVFSSLLDNISPEETKILKIDIEGAEYAVFEDLYNNGVLNKFDLIIGEYHNGSAGIEKYLDDFICSHKSSDRLQADFCYLNKRM